MVVRGCWRKSSIQVGRAARWRFARIAVNECNALVSAVARSNCLLT